MKENALSSKQICLDVIYMMIYMWRLVMVFNSISFVFCVCMYLAFMCVWMLCLLLERIKEIKDIKRHVVMFESLVVCLIYEK